MSSSCSESVSKDLEGEQTVCEPLLQRSILMQRYATSSMISKGFPLTISRRLNTSKKPWKLLTTLTMMIWMTTEVFCLLDKMGSMIQDTRRRFWSDSRCSILHGRLLMTSWGIANLGIVGDCMEGSRMILRPAT